ncbi:TPA: hypothetical protein ACTW89_004036, partial [Raoultella ornithinolytica]
SKPQNIEFYPVCRSLPGRAASEKWMNFCHQTICPSNFSARFLFMKLSTTFHIKFLSFILLAADMRLRSLIACPLASSYGKSTQSIHLNGQEPIPGIVRTRGN